MKSHFFKASNHIVYRMLRNQMLDNRGDPESPERRNVYPNVSAVKVTPPEYEDPWYAGSSDNSPRNEGMGGDGTAIGSFGAPAHNYGG